ncbi:MAG: class F sortase [Propionibacteriaceae bacterium]|nr:class F sortase [Propionibacteriaceae bacterium]
MTQAPGSKSHSRTALIVVGVALVLVLGLVIFNLVKPGTPTAQEPPAATEPASTGAEPAASTPTPARATASGSAGATDARLAECTEVTDGFVPQRFTIDALNADETVLALDVDQQGNIAAPPLDQPRTASWWSGGPKPGDEGRALLSIHTYNPSLPPALGNEMYEGGEPQLKAGDLIKLYGKDGQVLCYEYTKDHKFWMDEYDPDSDVMIRETGDPELAIIICWDYDKRTKNWDSRVLFYAEPVDLNAA